MKLLINFFVVIVFIAQFFSFVFSALNQKKPESITESLHNDVYFYAFLCSLMTIAIFAIQYNFNWNLLKKRVTNCIFLVIVLPGIYIHILELLSLNGFMLIACILLLFDYYIIRKILNYLFKSKVNLEKTNEYANEYNR